MRLQGWGALRLAVRRRAGPEPRSPASAAGAAGAAGGWRTDGADVVYTALAARSSFALRRPAPLRAALGAAAGGPVMARYGMISSTLPPVISRKRPSRTTTRV